MKVGILGDCHGNWPFTATAIRHLKNLECDLIFQLGDFGIWPKGQHFVDNVDTLCGELSIPLFFCEGNHCDYEQLSEFPIDPDTGWRIVRQNIHHAPRGHIWEWGGITFLAMGGAHSIDGPGGIWTQVRGPGNGWWPEETITVEQVYRAIENINGHYSPVDVMFTHDAPLGAQVPGISGYPAGDVNRDLLRQVVDAAHPKFLFHGHMHRFYEQEGLGGMRDLTVVGLGADISGWGKSGRPFVVLDTAPLGYRKMGSADAILDAIARDKGGW